MLRSMHAQVVTFLAIARAKKVSREGYKLLRNLLLVVTAYLNRRGASKRQRRLHPCTFAGKLATAIAK